MSPGVQSLGGGQRGGPADNHSTVSSTGSETTKGFLVENIKKLTSLSEQTLASHRLLQKEVTKNHQRIDDHEERLRRLEEAPVPPAAPALPDPLPNIIPAQGQHEGPVVPDYMLAAQHIHKADLVTVGSGAGLRYVCPRCFKTYTQGYVLSHVKMVRCLGY